MKKVTERASITRDELQLIEAPPPTDTWRPIKHFDLLVSIEKALGDRKIQMGKEELSIARGGAFFFAIIETRFMNQKLHSDYMACMAIRASNNKKMGMQINIAARVLVCDNLAFSGDVMVLRRRHTSTLDLEEAAQNAIDKYCLKFRKFSAQITWMKESGIDDSKAKTIIFDAFIQRRIMSIRLLPTVARLYFKPLNDDFKARTLWSLHNAFTSAAKNLTMERKFHALHEIGQLFNDIVPNISHHIQERSTHGYTI